jgi:hypothetical protein
MKRYKLKDFLALVSDFSITDNAWSDVFMSLGYEMMTQIKKDYNIEMIKEVYLKLESVESRFKFMQVWSQDEDFSNFEFFLNQISDNDVETSETIFDNLRSWNLDEKRKFELISAIKKIDRRSKLIDIIIERIK